MQDWEDRWPDRIYKFMRIHDYETAEDDRACRVVFDYKFIAYSYRRDSLSAGLGRTTIVLADLYDENRMRIVAEHGHGPVSWHPRIPAQPVLMPGSTITDPYCPNKDHLHDKTLAWT